jgi:hypothetical protein
MSIRTRESVEVVNDELDPVSPKILAKAIISISASMKKLLGGRLTELIVEAYRNIVSNPEVTRGTKFQRKKV